MKTGALILFAVEAGGILGGASDEEMEALRLYGREVGLAFQIADDILDVEGDEEAAGKKLRKDAGAGKETFLSLLGLDRARSQAQMLVDQAIEHLHAYGREADLLRAVARFVLERDR
jgi:farnesyl diphosphate synthase